MKEVRGKLVARIKRTLSVESFRFALKEKLNFIPGQFLRVIFDEGNRNNKELNKYLSFSASPTKEYIEVSKKLSDSNFSQKLRGLKINDEILFNAPLGNCVFRDNYEKIGFLIGGIGITPVTSMLEYIVDKRLNTNVVLLYSNRTEEDIAFRKELDYWQAINSNIKVFYTITGDQPKDSNYIFGYINEDLVTRLVSDLDDRIFFIFGPPKMVGAMENLCIELNCKRENIKTESFLGY